MAIPAAMAKTLKTLAGAGLGAAFAAPILEGPAEALQEGTIRPLLGQKTGLEYEVELAMRQPAQAQLMERRRRLQETMAFNQALLAQRFPGLYAKLLAGRPLPPGASVYGGVPQTQNVESAAMAMTQGRFGPPAPPPGMAGIMGP